MDDATFLAYVAAALADLPAVCAVSLGGSRATGSAGPGSDWDLGIYYRGAFSPRDVRGLGWEGTVGEIGSWGGGIFNGGAWLRVDGRHVDVHYRDLDVVEREIERGGRGEFHVEPLLFHLAGIPSYLLTAEVALGTCLRGELPAVTRFPDPLRAAAARHWAGTAGATLGYAVDQHLEAGRKFQCAGLLAVAAAHAAHAILARRGQWVTNEKRLLSAAGLEVALPPAGPEMDGGAAAMRRVAEQISAALAEL